MFVDEPGVSLPKDTVSFNVCNSYLALEITIKCSRRLSALSQGPGVAMAPQAPFAWSERGVSGSLGILLCNTCGEGQEVSPHRQSGTQDCGKVGPANCSTSTQRFDVSLCPTRKMIIMKSMCFWWYFLCCCTGLALLLKRICIVCNATIRCRLSVFQKVHCRCDCYH